MKNSSKKKPAKVTPISNGKKVLPVLKHPTAKDQEGNPITTAFLMLGAIKAKHPEGYSLPQMKAGFDLIAKLEKLPKDATELELEPIEHAELVRHVKIINNWIDRDPFIYEFAKSLE